MPSETSQGVRVDWACHVRNVYQAAIGDLLDGDPAGFSAAVNRVTCVLPTPADAVEALHLRESMTTLVDRMARTAHARFHANFSPASCRGTPSPLCESTDWRDGDTPLEELLDRAAITYDRWFDQHHDVPAALRATRFLQQHFAERLTIEAVARSAGCSRTTLLEQFTSVLGISPSEYLARLRVREGNLRRLRASDGSVETAARDAGYQSVNKFYARIKRYTGLSPSEVRRMDETAFERILVERLRVTRGCASM
jgi:AraC-like DNA-binding protein